VFSYKQSVPAFFSVKPACLRRWVLISGGVEGVSGVGLWLGLRLLLGVGVGVNSPGPNLRVGLRLGPRLATGTWPTFDVPKTAMTLAVLIRRAHVDTSHWRASNRWCKPWKFSTCNAMGQAPASRPLSFSASPQSNGIFLWHAHPNAKVWGLMLLVRRQCDTDKIDGASHGPTELRHLFELASY